MAEIKSIAQALDEFKEFKGCWIGYLYVKKDSLTFSIEDHYGIPGTDITKPIGELSFAKIDDFDIDIDELNNLMIVQTREVKPGEIEFQFESGTARIVAGEVNWMSYEGY
jgi:hypothetical protein